MEERSLSLRARKKAKAAHEKAEKERHVQLFQRRMDLARNGAVLYKQAKFKEAVDSFYRYLSILERWKNVKSGALEPKYFDTKKDVAELLLLTGVFWDLARVYDRYSKKDLTKLKFYLDRYVMFSKGMPYQHVCAELVRKHLVNGSPKNRKAFKDTYLRLGGGKCFIATAVEEHTLPETVPALRKFRDEKLLTTAYGRVFVKFYYAISPSIARLLIRSPSTLQKRIAGWLDLLVSDIKKT